MSLCTHGRRRAGKLLGLVHFSQFSAAPFKSRPVVTCRTSYYRRSARQRRWSRAHKHGVSTGNCRWFAAGLLAYPRPIAWQCKLYDKVAENVWFRRLSQMCYERMGVASHSCATPISRKAKNAKACLFDRPMKRHVKLRIVVLLLVFAAPLYARDSTRAKALHDALLDKLVGDWNGEQKFGAAA